MLGAIARLQNCTHCSAGGTRLARLPFYEHRAAAYDTLVRMVVTKRASRFAVMPSAAFLHLRDCSATHPCGAGLGNHFASPPAAAPVRAALSTPLPDPWLYKTSKAARSVMWCTLKWLEVKPWPKARIPPVLARAHQTSEPNSDV